MGSTKRYGANTRHIPMFKAALINILVLIIVHYCIICNVNEVACSDETIDNYHLTEQFPSALWSVCLQTHLPS